MPVKGSRVSILMIYQKAKFLKKDIGFLGSQSGSEYIYNPYLDDDFIFFYFLRMPGRNVNNIVIILFSYAELSSVTDTLSSY